MRTRRIIIAATALLLLLNMSTVAAAWTYWQHDPAGVGDWFDPDNWSNGLPRPYSHAAVTNNGTAAIGSGTAVSDAVCLGDSNATGSIIQTGGEHELSNLELANGRYELSGTASLSAGDECIASNQSAIFSQTGGENRVQYGLVVGAWDNHTGTYELSGTGLLEAKWEVIARKGSGLLRQTGGTNVTEWLEIGPGGRYEMLAGSLAIDGGGLANDGTLDFGDAPVSLSVDNCGIDFARGTFLGTGAASLTIGPNALVMVPPGFDPATEFGTISNAGIIHTSGTPLYVGPGQGFRANLRIEDFVHCAGTIMWGSGYEPLELAGGLMVADEGRVDLANVSLTIGDSASGISGGSLSAPKLCVGHAETATFTQTAGAVCVTWDIYLGLEDGLPGAFLQTGGTTDVTGRAGRTGVLNVGWESAGTYELSGTGVLRADVQYIGRGGEGAFKHTGGTNKVGSNLYVGYGDTGTYELSGGTNEVGSNLYVGYDGTGTYELSGTASLTAQVERVGTRADGLFRQTGGTNRTTSLEIGPAGRYELHGGSLTVDGSDMRTVSLLNEGVLDLGDGSADLTIRSGTAHLGTVLNAGAASLTVGPDCLLIAPEGFDPPTMFGAFSSAGLIHTIGTPWTVAPGETFPILWMGTFQDPVHCKGTIAQLEYNAYFNGGLRISGAGDVNLPGYTVTIRGPTSGISGGTISAGELYVGCEYSEHPHVPHFTQTGGSVVADSLTVCGGEKILGVVIDTSDGLRKAPDEWYSAYSPAHYVISAGSLRVGTLEVGMAGGFYAQDVIEGRSTLEIASAADVFVFEKLTMLATSELVAEPGATIHMVGADFSVYCQKHARPILDDLANVTMIFEGGTDVMSRFTAPGRDLGATRAGWLGNNALGVLQLGGVAPGRIALPAFSHCAGYGSALYVHELVLKPGATISMGYTPLYYLNGGDPKQLFHGDANLDGMVGIADLLALADNYGLVTGARWARGDFNGDGAVGVADLSMLADNYGAQTSAPVPEPTAVSLLLVAGASALRARRRRRRRG